MLIASVTPTMRPGAPGNYNEIEEAGQMIKSSVKRMLNMANECLQLSEGGLWFDDY